MAEWGDRVHEMWKAGTLSPKPVDQELEPIYKILLTDAVKAILHDDGTPLDTMNVLSTAVKYYSEYCTLMGQCDFPACPTVVRLDGDFYHETVHAIQGRKIYEDKVNRNYLMYREGNFTNEWIVVPTTNSESIIKQTAPCPQVGGKFKPYDTVSNSNYPKNLPSENWSTCSIKCQNDIKCNFWQYNTIFKQCQLIEDYDSIESSTTTTDYFIGSKDCPGDPKGLIFL